jgi:hypothetical protein
LKILWADYLKQVAPELKGCPRAMMIEAIRNTTIELCEKAFCWRELQSCEYPVGASQGCYDFHVDPGSVVHRIDKATLDNGTEMEVRTTNFADTYYPQWRAGKVIGPPTIITQVTPEQFILIPFPASNGTLSLEVSLKPTRLADGAPKFIYNEWVEVIGAGAKARLMVMDNKPWSNEKKAGVYMSAFNEASKEIHSRAGKAFGRAPNRCVPQYL